MDHSLKIWRLDLAAVQKGIHDSYLYQPQKHTRAFPTVNQNFPDFTTRDIHQNYVDCVRWLGNLILSKVVFLVNLLSTRSSFVAYV